MTIPLNDILKRAETLKDGGADLSEYLFTTDILHNSFIFMRARDYEINYPPIMLKKGEKLI